jgi:hypothetical protein
MFLTRHDCGHSQRIDSILRWSYFQLRVTAVVNTILAVINLIPIPPLDGSKIWPVLIGNVRVVLSPRTQRWLVLILLIVVLRTNYLHVLVTGVLDRVKVIMPAAYTEIMHLKLRAAIDAAKDWDYAKAEDFASEAIQINPSYATAYCLRGRYRLNIGNVTGAIEDANRACQLDPNNSACQAILKSARDSHQAPPGNPARGT